MSNVKCKKSNVSKGFSIIEVIIAVFVIVVGLVAMMNLMANSLKHTIDSRNLIIASSLAQEGVELVRNIRDNNWADGDVNPFIDNLPNADKDKCIIDKSSTQMVSGTECKGSNDYFLYFVSNFYVHGGVPANKTKFQRKIIINYCDDTSCVGINQNNATKAIVQSIVAWGSSFPASCAVGSKCVIVEDILTDWH